MHQVSVGYPTMHKALVFLYVYNSPQWFPYLQNSKKINNKNKGWGMGCGIFGAKF